MSIMITMMMMIKVQHPTFSMPCRCPSVQLGITEYYNLGRPRHNGYLDTKLSYHVLVSTFCCSVWSQSTNVRYRQTDRQTDRLTNRRHARSI